MKRNAGKGAFAGILVGPAGHSMMLASRAPPPPQIVLRWTEPPALPLEHHWPGLPTVGSEIPGDLRMEPGRVEFRDGRDPGKVQCHAVCLPKQPCKLGFVLMGLVRVSFVK